MWRRNSSSSNSPGVTGLSLDIGAASVIIDNFDVRRTRSGPPEADAILIVHPNAVLPRPVALECFQPIPGWHSQIMQPPGNRVEWCTTVVAERRERGAEPFGEIDAPESMEPIERLID